MLNKTVQIGRLTKDPDVRTIESGDTVASFTLAVERDFKDRNGNKGTDWIPVVFWGASAKTAGQYLYKGSQICVVGRFQTRSYENKEGKRVFVSEVAGEQFYFLSSPGKQEQKKEVEQESFIEDEFGFEEDYEDAPF